MSRLQQFGNYAAWYSIHHQVIVLTLNLFRTEMITDAFCAASLILPDKAGRQVTVGGWDEDSNFGVRFYYPDGSAGVNGTNQWQENPNTLTLQLPRWYPSAMMMANGSVMIVRLPKTFFLHSSQKLSPAIPSQVEDAHSNAGNLGWWRNLIKQYCTTILGATPTDRRT
jgi:hypothetical protein